MAWNLLGLPAYLASALLAHAIELRPVDPLGVDAEWSDEATPPQRPSTQSTAQAPPPLGGGWQAPPPVVHAALQKAPPPPGSGWQQGKGNATIVVPAHGGKPSTCVKYMHIPKTGGTSIDSTNFHLPVRVFGSLMADSFDRLVTNHKKVYRGVPVADVFDSSHENFSKYVPFMLSNLDSYRLHVVDPFHPYPLKGICEDVHTPPHLVARVDYYFRSSCGVFCNVRNPVDRYLSGYKLWKIGACTPAALEASASAHLQSLVDTPFQLNCHFAKQVLFVYGANSRGESRHTYCQNVLHTENLASDFQMYMATIGHPEVRIQPQRMLDTAKECALTRKDMSVRVLKQIYDYYYADFEAFGYPRPY